MAHLVHRQRMTRRRVEPRGADALKASVSRWGLLALAGAIVYLALELQPVFAPGVLGQVEPIRIVLFILGRLGQAVLISLVLFVELGFPRARKVNRWLWRGALVMAIQPLGRTLLTHGLQALGGVAPDLAATLSDNSQIGGWAMWLLTTSLVLPTLSGGLSIGDGLAHAGARPHKGILLIAALAGPVATWFLFAAQISQIVDLSQVIGWLNLVSLLGMMATASVWLMVAARLVMGPREGTNPEAAWFIGFVAGTLMLMDRFGNAAIAVFDPQGTNALLGTLIAGAGGIAPIILALAFALGMARGTRRRRFLPPLTRLYVVNPTS